MSDSDSLFLEEVDEGTNVVQMAVTTLTKHNLLLVEKLQSAKVSAKLKCPDYSTWQVPLQGEAIDELLMR